MTLTFLPNEADATFNDQAEPDSIDFEILLLGYQRTGVVSGCAVTEAGTPAQTIDVASGVVELDGARITVAADAGVAITNADATNPRIDLVTVNSSGAVVVTDGTAAANPVCPAIPANSVPLATVYTDGGIGNPHTVNDNEINDKRVLLDSTPIIKVTNGTELKTELEAAGDSIIVLDPNATGDYQVPDSFIESDLTNGNKMLLGCKGQEITGVQTTLGDFTWTDATGNLAQTSHGLIQGQRIRVSAAGTSGLSTTTTYWVNYVDANNITLALTRHGAAINTLGSDSTVTLKNYFNCYWRLTGGASGAGKHGIYVENIAYRGDFEFVNANFVTFREIQQRYGIIEVKNRNTNGWSEFIDFEGDQSLTDDADVALTFDRSWGNADQGNGSFKGCRFKLTTSGGARGLLAGEATNLYNGFLDLSVWNPQPAAPCFEWEAMDNDEKWMGTEVRLHIEESGNATYGVEIDNTGTGYPVIHGLVDMGIARYQGPAYTLGNNYTNATGRLPDLRDIEGVSIWGNREPAAAITLGATDGVVNVDTSSGAVTVTLPDCTEYNGVRYLIRNDSGTNNVTVNVEVGDTFDEGGATSKTLSSDGASIGIFSTGGTEWKIAGTRGTVT